MQRRLTYSVRKVSGDKENKPPCHPTSMGPEKKGRGRGVEGEKGGAEKEGKRRGVGEKGRHKEEREGGGEGLQKKKRSPLKNVPSKLVLQNKLNHYIIIVFSVLRSPEVVKRATPAAGLAQRKLVLRGTTTKKSKMESYIP